MSDLFLQANRLLHPVDVPSELSTVLAHLVLHQVRKCARDGIELVVQRQVVAPLGVP
jgi:hypothetical protein